LESDTTHVPKSTFLRTLTCSSEYEEAAYTEYGAQRVAGIDECARGNLFGPTCAAAVILPRVLPESLQGKLRDSKLISAGERARLAEEIKACAVAWRVTEISSEVIDRINIAKAVEMAMYEAIHGLSVTPDFLLIDAVTIDIPIRQMAIEHGDALSVSIAAASILAKTHHSELMVAFDAEYPGYGLAKHKGYGTREHMAALELLGPTPLHRRSYAPIKALCRVQYNAQMV
jgi:ribonuclease HII